MQRRPEDPTPEEIAERCAEIRAEWTEEQERKARTGSRREKHIAVQIISTR